MPVDACGSAPGDGFVSGIVPGLFIIKAINFCYNLTSQ